MLPGTPPRAPTSAAPVRERTRRVCFPRAVRLEQAQAFPGLSPRRALAALRALQGQRRVTRAAAFVRALSSALFHQVQVSLPLHPMSVLAVAEPHLEVVRLLEFETARVPGGRLAR